KTDAERWASGAPDRAGFTLDNYVFENRGEQPDGLVSLQVKPRRKDVLFVDGSIFLNPDDGDLVRLEGRLSKSPSFWTRRVEIVRWFRRFAGFRMPVAVESVANILIAGRAAFRLTYEYESVHGHHVGDPQPQRRTAELRYNFHITFTLPYLLVAALVTFQGAALQRFLARGDSPAVAYRALRHLEARN